MSQASLRRGRLVARALAGAWRTAPSPAELSEPELEEAIPLLLETGSAGLVWNRIRTTPLADTTPGRQIREAFVRSTATAALREHELAASFDLLNHEGVRAVLAKGWAAACLYPEPGFRPYSDIDLCVAKTDLERARSILPPDLPVDLHAAFRVLDRDFTQLYSGSRQSRIGTTPIRVVGHEDHLRLLALHLLDHGVFRPLWLCDVGTFLEGLPSGFEWDRCLAGKTSRTEWMSSALQLAAELLGADLARLPNALKKPLPNWVVPAVLNQWGTFEHYMHSRPMVRSLLHPASLPRALRLRWPNAVQATIGVRGSFNRFPRFPYQVLECLRRTIQLLLQAPRLVKELHKKGDPVARGR